MANSTQVITPAAASTQSDSPLLNLPPELRNRIWELVLPQKHRICDEKSSRGCRDPMPGILHTCRQMRADALSMWYAQTTFVMRGLEESMHVNAFNTWVKTHAAGVGGIRRMIFLATFEWAAAFDEHYRFDLEVGQSFNARVTRYDATTGRETKPRFDLTCENVYQQVENLIGCAFDGVWAPLGVEGWTEMVDVVHGALYIDDPEDEWDQSWYDESEGLEEVDSMDEADVDPGDA